MATGKGSIEKRDSEGYSWKLVVCSGYTKEGKKIRQSKTVKVEGRTFDSRKKAAERELSLFLAEVDKGTYFAPNKLTVSDLIEKWLADYVHKNLEPKTAHRYEELLKGRVFDALGHIKLIDLKPIHLLDFYSNLQESGIRKDKRSGNLSNTTIYHYHKTIKAMLNDAVDWQLLNQNVAAKICPPKHKYKEMQCFTSEQAALLLNALDSEPLKYRLITMLDIVTGLRRGELMALQWKYIDTDKGTIQIRYSLQYVPGQQLTLKEPKNISSTRKLAIPKFICDLLKTHEKEQKAQRLKVGDQWIKDSDFVFTTWNGSAMHPDSVSKWFPKFLKKYNNTVKNNKTIPDETKEKLYLPVVNFHQLRHTAATLLIDKGLSVKAVSDRLGHAKTSTTLNIYAHSLQSADKQAADMMEDMFNPKKETEAKQA